MAPGFSALNARWSFTFLPRVAQSSHKARAHPCVAKSVVILVDATIVSKRKEALCPVLLRPAGTEHSQELCLGKHGSYSEGHVVALGQL